MPSLALLTEALRAFGTAKVLARAASCHPKTAERWQRGDTQPDVLSLTKLMGKSRAIADAILKMAGLDDLSLAQEEARLVRELTELRNSRKATDERLGQIKAKICELEGGPTHPTPEESQGNRPQDPEAPRESNVVPIRSKEQILSDRQRHLARLSKPTANTYKMDGML